MNVSPFQFNKQFFICSTHSYACPNQSSHSVPSLFNNWHKTPLINNAILHCHPELNITKVSGGEIRLICLGSIINPYRPEQNNEEVLTDVVSEISGAFTAGLKGAGTDDSKAVFNTFESALYHLSGRFVLIIITKQGIRIYHDAAGLKPVFYSEIHKHTPAVASQPALLEYLGVTHKNKALFKEFEQYQNSSSWPINVVPYDNVKQLQPNHYLELSTLNANRFWPKTNIANNKKNDLTDISSKMNEILQGTVKALTLRNQCTLSLTGGYDSRMLFSSALALIDNINFFTTVSDYTPEYEIESAKKIAQIYNLNHQFTKRDEENVAEQNIISILNDNVGGMYYDRSRQNIFAFAQAVGSGVHLPGSVSEIARCNYYPYGTKMRKPTGQLLAKYTGFKNNPIAAKGFDSWLQRLPKALPFDILDMVYWEHRLGVWGSCGLTYREGVIDQIPPMNNRAFMALSLSADIKDRLPPHNLIRQIIKSNAPDLLNILFNGKASHKVYDTYPRVKYIREVLFGWIK